jgi:putative ABC transport system permease protein
MNGVLHDFRHALRRLRAAPSSTAAAVLIIALGTGVNAAVFAVTFGILLRPLPYPEAARLVVMSIQVPDGTDTGILLDEFEDWRSRLRSIQSASAYTSTELTMTSRLEPRRVQTAIVTDAFFEVLGVPPVRGRTTSARDSAGAVAISSALAAEMSGALDVELLGSGLTIGGRAYTISAIMPPSFAFPNDRVNTWVSASSVRGLDASSMISKIGLFRIVARPKPGATLPQVREDVLRAGREIHGDKFGKPGSVRPNVTPLEETLVGRVRLILPVSMAAAILVLLVASANVGTLLLERAIVRHRQLAVRVALGASSWQLARGVLIEGLLVVGAGSALGVGADLTAVPLFVRAAGGVIPQIQAVAVDVPVLAFSMAVVFVVTLLCGVPAALKIPRDDFAQCLRGVRSTVPSKSRRLMAGLIVAQLALSIVLLAGAGLFARTVASLLEEDAGFDPTNALTVELALSDITPPKPAERALFVREVIDRVRSLPGVQHAGIGSFLPPIESPVQIYIARISESKGEFQRMSVGWVTPAYFDALGGRLLHGRLFEEFDAYHPEPVVLLSKSAARFLSPEQDPVGRVLSMQLPPITGLSGPPRVLGIVDDMKFSGLDAPADAAVYVTSLTPKADHLYLVVRTEGDPMALAPAVHNILQQLDPSLPLLPIASLQEEMAMSIAERRMRVIAAGGFAAVALAIALVGLFAQIGREVAERRQELAIRLALGASPRRIVRMLVAHVALLVTVGVVVGLSLAGLALRGIASLLYGVTSSSPATLCAAAIAVGVAALCASYFPVRRATHLKPAEWLRAE